MNRTKFNYFMGSFFFLVGVLSITLIPRILDMTELLFIPENGEYTMLAALFFTIANIFYFISNEYYKNQIVWIAFLFSFYVLYQMVSL